MVSSTLIPKPVLSLAPDALIFVNGTEALTTCVRCGKETILVEDVSEVSVTITMEGSNQASFTVIAPRYDQNRYVVNGTPILKVMSEVEIYMRGRFLVNGEPRYYPVFWGIITSTSDKYSDGQNSISISCSGILRWWEMSKINVQPSLTAAQIAAGSLDPSPWVNIFGKADPFSIIWHLATLTTGGLCAPQGFEAEALRASPVSRKAGAQLDQQMMEYWAKRIQQVGRSLRMFGWNGERVDPTLSNDLVASGTNQKATVVMNPPPTRFVNLFKTEGFDPSRVDNDDEFRPFGQIAKGFDIFASEITSKLEMANQVKSAISYEFYQDSTGEIIFKPPFYNLDVRPFPPYNIDPIDLVSSDITENEAEVYTRLDVKGLWHDLLKEGDATLLPYGYYVDPKLAPKFGLRAQSINMNFLRSSMDCFLYAVSELDRLNKRRYSGTIVIKGRPELRVGFPIYIRDTDSFYYVVSISHSFSFGGTFNTTLGVEAIRRRVYDQARGDILRNRVYSGVSNRAYYGEVGPVDAKNLKQDAFLKSESNRIKMESELEREVSILDDFIPQPSAAKIEINNTISPYVVGMDANDWVLEEDPSIQQVSIATHNSKTAPKNRIAVPYTDADGFEVLGGFAYGRNLEVSPTGALRYKSVTSPTGKSTALRFPLSTAIDEDLFRQTQQRDYTDSGLVMSRILNMEPSGVQGSTGDSGLTVNELDGSIDLTLESGKAGVTQTWTDNEAREILSMDPGLRKSGEQSRCSCSRLDKKLDPIIRKTQEEGLKFGVEPSPTINSTQPQVLSKLDEFVALDSKDFSELTDSELIKLRELREELEKAGQLPKDAIFSP